MKTEQEGERSRSTLPKLRIQLRDACWDTSLRDQGPRAIRLLCGMIDVLKERIATLEREAHAPVTVDVMARQVARILYPEAAEAGLAGGRRLSTVPGTHRTPVADYTVQDVPRPLVTWTRCGKPATKLYRIYGQLCDEHRAYGGVYTSAPDDHKCSFPVMADDVRRVPRAPAEFDELVPRISFDVGPPRGHERT